MRMRSSVVWLALKLGQGSLNSKDLLRVVSAWSEKPHSLYAHRTLPNCSVPFQVTVQRVLSTATVPCPGLELGTCPSFSLISAFPPLFVSYPPPVSCLLSGLVFYAPQLIGYLIVCPCSLCNRRQRQMVSLSVLL